jgi:Metallo-peptidase family M12B Reprolysin-like
MKNRNIATLIILSFFCLLSTIINVTSEIIIEAFYKPEAYDERRFSEIGDNVTDDDWEPLNAANVSASPLFKSPIIKFVIHTATKIRTKTYHFNTAKFRNLTSSGTLNETIWFGSLRPIVAARRGSIKPKIHWLTSRQKKFQTGFASLYERSGRIHSATFTTDTAVYDIVFKVSSKTYMIRSRRWQDFSSEDNDHMQHVDIARGNVADLGPESSMNISFDVSHVLHPSKRSWVSVESTFSSELPQGRHRSLHQNNSSSVNRVEFDQRQHARAFSGTIQTNKNEDNGNQEISLSMIQSNVVVIDVLVIVSHAGMCEYAFRKGASCANNEQNRAPITNRLKIVEAQTNNALKSIKVALRFVQIVFLKKGGWDPIVDDNNLDIISTSAEIIQWRQDIGADLVSVVGRESENCGLATVGKYSSITGQDCLVQYTLSHEIGHNFGAHHNKEDLPNTPSEYAFGYVRNKAYRTIMSSECGSSCPRVPYFSSATLKLPDGRILGSRTQNNMRQIFETAPAVAQYMDTVVTYAPTHPRPTSRPITSNPTVVPTTAKPTWSPGPTGMPSSTPTTSPTITRSPSSMPTQPPSRSPTAKPTVFLSCQRVTCRGGSANLMYRRYRLFGRQKCISLCIQQAGHFWYSRIWGFKCGKCTM